MNLRALFPRASKSFYDLNLDPPLPRPEPKRHQEKPLGSPVSGKEKGVGRITVRYTGFLVQPLDPDNFSASTKDCTDGLRRCGLIDGDEHWKIRLITEQERVETFAEERTIIEITYP